MKRRHFIRLSGTALAAGLAATGFPAITNPTPWKAALIGHTGRGDYGHGMDAVFKDLPGVTLVAVADANPAGLAKALAKLGNPKGYADYTEMLAREQPQLVCVAPRHADQHFAMGMAALKQGAHVFMEKPFTTSLDEADALLAEAKQRGLKIAVAHQMRMDVPVVRLKQALAEGLIGELLEIRAYGKQDARAGGEDLMVLGTHLFDLIRLLAGDPFWCSARMLEKGRDVTVADGRLVKDQIGLVAGDEILAHFALPHGVNAIYQSRARLKDYSGHWGLELIGSKGAARIKADIPTNVYVMKTTGWKAEGRTDAWEPFALSENTPGRNPFDVANRRLVEDWLAAITKSGEPQASGDNAMKAVEMVMAVYQSALAGNRVSLPLAKRGHPLR